MKLFKKVVDPPSSYIYILPPNIYPNWEDDFTILLSWISARSCDKKTADEKKTLDLTSWQLYDIKEIETVKLKFSSQNECLALKASALEKS